MPPHGPGMVGGAHSHDVSFPDDSWNLYAMLDPSTTALNVSKPDDAIAIFKPHAHRLDAEPTIVSDADAEIIVIARFTSPCHVRKLMVIGGGDSARHPSSMKCYVNQEVIDFTGLEALTPAQEFDLPVNEAGLVELTTVLHSFTNINTIAFYFPANHGGGDSTAIQYIGMQGEHTHHRREAVNTTYEVLCNGSDIQQPEDALAGIAKHSH